jgi:hypothetical protein
MLAVVARIIQPPLLVVAHRWLEKHGGSGAGSDDDHSGHHADQEDFVQV